MCTFKGLLCCTLQFMIVHVCEFFYYPTLIESSNIFLQLVLLRFVPFSSEIFAGLLAPLAFFVPGLSIL
jgi:hypothetical protein